MKKGWLFGVLSLIVLLAACTQEELDAQAHFEKSLEVMNDIDSFSMTMDMVQEMDIEGESMEITMTMEGDTVMDPLSMHQVQSMNFGAYGDGMEMEMYMSPDGIFMLDAFSEQWTKLPDDMISELLELGDVQVDPGHQLAQLADYIDDIEIEETDDMYRFVLSSANVDLASLVADTLPDDFLGGEGLADEALSETNIRELEYEILIDKNTHYQKELSIITDIEMTLGGETVPMKQEVHATFHSFNEINQIVVPSDVLENAADISTMF